MKFPDFPRKRESVEKTVSDIIRYLRASRITSMIGGRVEERPGGTTLVVNNSFGRNQNSTSTFCFFGQLVTITSGETTSTGICGGICYCGDKNFNVEPWEVDLGADGVWLVYLSVPCQSQRDDDGEIFLPGIVTSSASAGDLFAKISWTDGTDYPDNTNPDVSDGLGTVIVPLGKLTVADGIASFAGVGCGNVRINQCAGILSSSRE